MKIDKIYSRKRLKFHKKSKVKVIIYLFFILLIISIISFVMSSYPIFEASCKTAAQSSANSIVSNVIQNIMKEYNYSDFVNVEKDVNEKVILVESNTVQINKIVSEIIDKIQEDINNSPTTLVYINYGTITGISIFKNVGPKFEIELETAGNIKTELESEFENIGINQTIHKIYLLVNTKIGILTPFGIFDNEVNNRVLLTESIIIGDIPNTYYNLNEIDKTDCLDILDN